MKKHSVDLILEKKKEKDSYKPVQTSFNEKNICSKKHLCPNKDQNRIGLKDQEPNDVLPHPRQTAWWVEPSPTFNGRIIGLIHSEVSGIPAQHCCASSPPRTPVIWRLMLPGCSLTETCFFPQTWQFSESAMTISTSCTVDKIILKLDEQLSLSLSR